MLTVLEVIRKTAEFFAAKGVDSPRLNAELIVGHVLGLPRMQLYLQFERLLGDGELEAVRALVRRRGRREPLQYLLGHVEFSGLRLKVDPRALIPRPETEHLVGTVLARCASTAPARVLDLGTGSGAIALALALAWPEARVTAVDASGPALELARENADAAGLGGRVEFLLSDWFSAVPPGERFDLIVANPPYLSEAETASAAPEVREHEPAGALASADGGLADLRAILESAPRYLAPAGWIALETGADQHGALREIAPKFGWSRLESLRDLAGRDRYVFGFR